MKNSAKIIGIKLISILTILTLVIYIVINLINEKNVQAAQYNENYDASKITKYPGYKELIETMKAKHPNWNFTIFYTGLDWNTVIENETTKSHGRNVVPASWSSVWKCKTCGETPHGGTSWRCASTAAVSYYMDPRNWINDTYIFQFETLSYNSKIQTIEGVKKIISNMGYMQGNTISYTKTDGTQGTINKSYAQVIMEAAQEANISPYHLASRLKQEQGTGSKPGSTATGTYGGYVGYYNYMNIKASGSGDAEVIRNGLEHAKNNNWTTPEISIKEGAKVLSKNYINDGADTIYLQKFDVDSSDNTLYYFQYMQNVAVCLTEGANARESYEELGFINNAIDFRIPVYENMPSIPCGKPAANTIVTQNVKIKGNSVRIRSSASNSSDNNIIQTVNMGYDLLRIELAATQVNGIHWDKVVLQDGRKGYVARSYLTQVEDITNCNEAVTTTTEVYLRNGPGIENTTTVDLLPNNQYVRRIEKNKYNVDGYIWDRVILPNGTQGYVAQKYLKNAEPNNKYKLENGNLVCEPGTTVESIKEKNQGREVTIKNAKGEVVNSGNVGTGYTVSFYDNKYTVVKLGDVNGDGLIKTVDYMKIKNHIMNEDILTGYNLQAADTNKDGRISTIDYMMIKNQIMSISNIEL